jgi:pyruvyltransferase
MNAAAAPLNAFWCRIPSRPNFGDALTPWLIRKLNGSYPRFVRPDDLRHKYFAVGSIVRYSGPACTIWGSGIMNRYDPISPDARLLAVRGPLTRARALECGAECPEIFGDPALLLPRLYQAPMMKRLGGGLVPHFADAPRLSAAPRLPGQLRLIDIQDPIESVIDQITSCEFVISSSLHGLITSHAYGVPAVWVKFRALPSGDDSKFHDYFLSLGQEPPMPVWIQGGDIPLDELAAKATVPEFRLDLDSLWAACPFRDPT